MGYKCLDCDSTDEFIIDRNYSASGWEKVVINSEGDWEEELDSEETDRESSDDGDVECRNCGSSNIEWQDEDTPQVITDWRSELNGT